MNVNQAIDDFLSAGPFAVAGASTDRAKYGNKVLRCYLQHGLEVFAVNPNRREVEGLTCYQDLGRVPASVRSVSVITPPGVTERVVRDAAAAGVGLIWMQPGAESRAAFEAAETAGMTVIAGGSCLLVKLGFREDWG